MTEPIRIAIAGAGLMGMQHIASIANCRNIELSAIVEPCEHGKLAADRQQVSWYRSLSDLFALEKPDGIILATPNQMHAENGLQCIAAGCPLLVEKPLASTADEAEVLVDAARQAGVPLLVGHHRRHNPIIQKARELISAGKLGRLRAVHVNCWMYKPDNYFDDAPWRKAHGAGPVSVNLVHDIDLVRYLCGEVISVQALTVSSIRGYENEDAASALLKLENDILVTLTVSDTVVSPWSWELTACENSAYPATSQSSYFLGGTHGSLSLPDLRLWHNAGPQSWVQPISATTFPRQHADSFRNQIRQFAEVISGSEQPLVCGEEGLKTLRVTESIKKSAKSGEIIYPHV